MKTLFMHAADKTVSFKVYNHASAAYIVAKAVKALNNNPNIPMVACTDGDSIGWKPFKK